MSITFPYVTDKFTAYLEEEDDEDIVPPHLSLAVWVTDEYTGSKPIGWIKIKVTLKERDIKVFRNLSGYYCFTNLDEGTYNITIESDYYFPEKKSFVIPLPDPPHPSNLPDSENPVYKIILKPKPNYPFPENATLVRGKMVSNPASVKDTTVEGFIIREACFKQQEYNAYLEKYPQAKKVLKPLLRPLPGRIDTMFCINLSEISDDDKKELKKKEAFEELVKMGRETCFKQEEYQAYLEKYPHAKEVLKTLERERDNKICIFLGEISDDIKLKLKEQAFEELVNHSKRETKTDEMGEFVLFFKGIEKKEENIALEIKKEDTKTKEVFGSLKEGTTTYWKIPLS